MTSATVTVTCPTCHAEERHIVDIETEIDSDNMVMLWGYKETACDTCMTSLEIQVDFDGSKLTAKAEVM